MQGGRPELGPRGTAATAREDGEGHEDVGVEPAACAGQDRRGPGETGTHRGRAQGLPGRRRARRPAAATRASSCAAESPTTGPRGGSRTGRGGGPARAQPRASHRDSRRRTRTAGTGVAGGECGSRTPGGRRGNHGGAGRKQERDRPGGGVTPPIRRGNRSCRDPGGPIEHSADSRGRRAPWRQDPGDTSPRSAKRLSGSVGLRLDSE